MRSKSARRAWYEAAFAGDYLRRYQHRSDAQARAEFPFLHRALALPPGARILDLCCGAGRHTRAFAEAGYEVVALDLSLDLLRAALSTAQKQSRKVLYVRADMRRLPLRGASIDGIVNLFTSFGYFASDEENERVIREAARVLRPGGTFFMDFLNLNATLKMLVPLSEKIVDGVAVKERRWFDRRTRRLNKSIRMKGRKTLRESVRAFSPAELKRLFEKAGLKVRRRYGDLSGAPFNPRSSPRCILLARKAP